MCLFFDKVLLNACAVRTVKRILFSSCKTGAVVWFTRLSLMTLLCSLARPIGKGRGRKMRPITEAREIDNHAFFTHSIVFGSFAFSFNTNITTTSKRRNGWQREITPFKFSALISAVVFHQILFTFLIPSVLHNLRLIFSFYGLSFDTLHAVHSALDFHFYRSARAKFPFFPPQSFVAFFGHWSSFADQTHPESHSWISLTK